MSAPSTVPPDYIHLVPAMALPLPSIAGVSSATAADGVARGPPRKRLRVSSRPEPYHPIDERDDDLVENLQSRTQSAKRDMEYYLPNADCIIRVGGTLFRVHKFLLSRDASAFQNMFSMMSDTDNTTLEGASDESPIILYGETEDNFRIMLGALYALPAELQTYFTPFADIPRLVTLASITNKYHFTSTAQWATSALYHVLGQYSSPSRLSAKPTVTSPSSPTQGHTQPWEADERRLPEKYDLDTCPPALLKRILDVAKTCGHDGLVSLIEERWVERLWDSLPSPNTNGGTVGQAQAGSNPSRMDMAKWAVRASDRWEMKRLRGVAYYTCLMEMGDELKRAGRELGEGGKVMQTEETEADEDEGVAPRLTGEQVSRLLLGHLSLVHIWDTRLHLDAPPIPAPSPGSCVYHQQGCIFSWVAAWQETARSSATLRYRSSDVIGRLKSMEKQLTANDGLIVALTPGCRRRALIAVREVVKVLKERLDDHFWGGAGRE